MRKLRTAGPVVLGLASGVFAADLVPLQPRMGAPLSGLSAEQLAQFEAGKILYEHNLTPDEGLGPVFNDLSCASCHSNPEVGGTGTKTVTRFGQITKGGFDPLEQFGGSLLQVSSVSPEGFPLDFCLDVLPDLPDVFTIQRVTTSSMGTGLIEAIDDADIVAIETSQIGQDYAGRIHWVTAFEDAENGQEPPLRVGKFGWKAQVPTVLTFSSDAGLNELGLTNRFLEVDNAPNGDARALAICDLAPIDPEDVPDEEGFDFIDRVTHFQAFLAAPPQTPRSGMTGEARFIEAGCSNCHVATSFVTKTVDGVPSLSGQTIKPYSDFLLHNMGTLGDGIVQGDASGLEFRTPPLWGLRFRLSFLHDPTLDDGLSSGTFAQRVDKAVELHGNFGSSAASSAEYYMFTFGQTERDQVVAFLQSLGRPEFDFAGGTTQDGDGYVENKDYAIFVGCINGPDDASYTPDDLCAIGDVDQDGDVDLVDISHYQRAVSDNPID